MLNSFFKKMLGNQPATRFNGTPEMFLAQMLFMEEEGKKNGPGSASAAELASVMMKIIKVDLSPYKSFEELQQKGVPDFEMINQLRPKLEDFKQKQELNDALYGKGARRIDPLADGSASSRSAGKLVTEMKKYLEFPED